MAFCGHGVLAAAAWLDAFYKTDDYEQVFQVSDSELSVFRDVFGSYYYLQKAYLMEPVQQLELDVQLEAVIGVGCQQAYFSVGAPREKLIVQTVDSSALSDIMINPELRDTLCKNTKTTGIYIYAVDNDLQDGSHVIAARHFPYGWKYVEDMATASIAPTITQHLYVNGLTGNFIIKQGGADCNYCQLFLEPSAQMTSWRVKGECVVDAVNGASMIEA